MPLVIGLAAFVGAILLLTSGITDASFADVITGKAGTIYRQNQPGTAAGGAGSSSGSPSPSSSPNIPAKVSGGGTVVGDVTYGDLEAIAKLHNWSTAEVDAWAQIIPLESNGTTTDTNSSSGAYGIAQMLANGGSASNLGPNMQKYYAYGGNPDTVMGQLTAMANYMEQSYGTPSKALSFHLEHGWY